MTQKAVTGQNRRETRSERKSYAFRPTVVTALDRLVEMEDSSEAEAISQAILQAVKKLPLLGEIPCGPLSEVPEDKIESWVTVGDLIKTQDGDFLLRARGSSMTGDGIMDGDLVLIRPQNSCDSGEVAAVMLDTAVGSRATLKKVEYSMNSPIVRLVPMNDSHEVVEIDTTKETLRICGVKRGIIRVH